MLKEMFVVGVLALLVCACSSERPEGSSSGGPPDAGPECAGTEALSCTCPNGERRFRRCIAKEGVFEDCPCSLPASGPKCIEPGSNCRGTESACCAGSTCVFDTADPSKTVCAATCANDAECNSGCCSVLIDGTAAVCAPPKYCAGSCARPNEPCSTTPCCANAVCVDSTVTGITCASRCARHEQCASGCCAPLSNTGELVCSPVTFCQ